MAEGTYEFECMRAELLGLDKPDYEEFMRNKKENEAKQVNEEELDVENIKDAKFQNDNLKNISGGLEELTNILQATQRKLNRFKVSCGSLTSMIKSKFVQNANSAKTNQGSSTENTTLSSDTTADLVPCSPTPVDSVAPQENGTNPRKSDLSNVLDNNVSRLDSLIEKSENASFAMEKQRKQMRSYMK